MSVEDDRKGDGTVGRGCSALRCVPGAIEAEERAGHFARIERLFGGAVVAFVRLERRCCPSLSSQLDVVAGSDEVRLRVHGPRGARALIEAELIGWEAEGRSRSSR